MKSYQLGLYEKAMPNKLSIREKLEAAKASGFDYMEISIDETEEKLERLWSTEKEQYALQQAAADNGLPIRSMCLSGHRKYPLGSHDIKTREKSLEILYRAADFACITGIRIIQLAGYDVYYETSGRDTRKWFAENLQTCVEYAASNSVTLGFETMETPFMDTVEKAMHYVNLIRSPYLGIYPDIGNLKNAAVLYGHDLCTDIETGAGHVLAAHLKETKPGIYRDMQFGTGHTEYEPCMKALWAQGVRMYTGEFWYQNEAGLDYLKAANRFLRGKIEKAIQSQSFAL